ncbi:MAG: hypothetical protein RIS13_910, partial [Bacteroidota bacterium]
MLEPFSLVLQRVWLPFNSFPKPLLHGLNNFQSDRFPLFETIFNRTLVVYATVKAAHGSFICSTPKRSKRPDWKTIRNFCIIAEL